MIGKWRKHYNEDRPHSSLGNLTPNEYAAGLARGETTPQPQRQRTLPAMGRSASICGVSAARPIAPAEATGHSQPADLAVRSA